MKSSLKAIILIILTGLNIIIPAKAIDIAIQNEQLIRIIILSRHGVRSPNQDAATLSQWAAQPWPTWPVKTGYLTERGKKLIQTQWEALRPVLQKNRLIPAGICPLPENYSVIADIDQRTRETAVALFEGIAPGCGIQPEWGKHFNQLFRVTKSNQKLMTSKNAVNEVQNRIDKLNHNPAAKTALNKLQEISQCCGQQLCQQETHTKSCTLPELSSQTGINIKKEKIDVRGNWSIALSMAEIMLLEYAQWPEHKAGWGKVNETTLQQIMPLHDQVFDAIHRAPILAKAQGSILLKTIKNNLLSEKSPRFIAYIAHDTNIANIGALLNMNWTIAGQSINPTTPGGFLSFELWQKNDGQREILVNYHTPTFASLHTEPAPVIKPASIAIQIPDCKPCDIQSFSKLVEKAITP